MKGRGKVVQIFHSKVLPGFEISSLEKNIPHFLLLCNSYKEPLTSNTTAFREEKVREDKNYLCCSYLSCKLFPWTE